jgi:hypothetical protein
VIHGVVVLACQVQPWGSAIAAEPYPPDAANVIDEGLNEYVQGAPATVPLNKVPAMKIVKLVA